MKLTKAQELVLADAISPGCSVFHHNLNVLKALERRGLIALPKVVNEATKRHSVIVTEAGRNYQFEHLTKFESLEQWHD